MFLLSGTKKYVEHKLGIAWGVQIEEVFQLAPEKDGAAKQQLSSIYIPPTNHTVIVVFLV